jgi:polyhydroxybutyrate depolymerase
MPRRFVAPLLFLTVLAALTTIAPVAQARTTASSPGCGRAVTPGSSTQTIRVGTASRSYLLVVPAGVVAGTPTPVVLALHGGSDTAQNAQRYMGLGGGQRPAIYVYPQAPYWPEAGGVGWNVDPAGVDLPYFDALLADLGNKHCVDSGRVFATGKSNGAFMVNALACFRPGMLRAIAPVAGGGPQGSRCTAPTSRGPAVMIVHGAADTAVPLRSGQFTRDYWLHRNGNTSAAPTPVAPAPCVRYPGTAVPVLWCQHSGGHTWPSWTGPGITNFFLSF